jgi:tRNA pseudouridine55 synthase
LGVNWALGVAELGIDVMSNIVGALLVDKPVGPTSHDIVAFVRRTLKTPRVGHTGTLDPLATGLLVLLVGPATRLAQFLAGDDKEYVADIRLGASTPTYDAASLADGVRCPMVDGRWPMNVEMEAVLARFRGSFLQVPPPYSAKKLASVPAYEKARKNLPVDLTPVRVTVRELQVLPRSDIGHRTSDIGDRTQDLEHGDLLRVRVAASAGFYVRSLAHDIGQALGCGAHLEALRRMRAGRFTVNSALTLDRVEAEGARTLLPMNTLLADMPRVGLTVQGLQRAVHGNDLSPAHTSRLDASASTAPRVRLVDDAGEVVAVAESRPGGLLHPLVVLR